MSLLWRLPRRSHSECSHRYPADSKRNDRISEKKPIWQGDIPSAQRSQTEGRISKAEAVHEKGVIGTCDCLASYEDRFSELFQSLLGRVLVVESIDDGIRIAAKYKHSFRIVTLDGDALNPGGSMSGGAYKNKSNLLGRNREIKELEQKLLKDRDEILRISKVLEEKTEQYGQAEEKISV